MVDWLEQRFTLNNGWRCLLKVQTGALYPDTFAGDGVGFELPKGTIFPIEENRQFDKLPIGFTDATMVKYKVNLNTLDRGATTTAGYKQFVDGLAKGFAIDSSEEYRYNIFALYTDYGDDTLDEEDYLLHVVTAQKPTIERTFELNRPLQVGEIDTICLAKLVAETYTMTKCKEDYWTVFDEAAEAYSNASLYDFYKNSTNGIYNINFQDYFITRTYVKSLKTALDRIHWLLVLKIRSKIVQTNDNTGLYNFLFSVNLVNPFISLTLYDNEQDDNQQPNATARNYGDFGIVTRLELQSSPVQSIGGFLSENSSESPFRNYNNVWNYLQDLAEQLCTKAIFVYAGAPNIDIFIYPFYEQIANYNGVLDFLPFKYTYDANKIRVKFTQGSEAVRGCKVTMNKRGDDDLNEIDTSVSISIADNEYNLKSFIFNSQPDIPESENLKERYAGNIFKYVIYGSKLYVGTSNPMVRVGDKATVYFTASDYVTNSASAQAFFPVSSTQQTTLATLNRQRSGGIIHAVAQAITLIFGANGSGFIEFETFSEKVKAGDVIELTNVASYSTNTGGWINTPEGSGISFEYCIVTEVKRDFTTPNCRLTIKAFTFQPTGIV